MKRILYVLLYFLIVLFYWEFGSNIENRTDSEDIYEYAQMVEIGYEHDWYLHRHHLFFGPLMHYSYNFFKILDFSFSSLTFIQFNSALSSAGILFYFFLFCYKRYSLRPLSSLLATIFLGSMYGFWRYSAEAEIIVIATFFMMAGIYYSTSLSNKKIHLYFGIIFSIISVLFHLMNSVAVFIAIPIFFILQKKLKELFIHLIICLIVVGFSYQYVYFTHPSIFSNNVNFQMFELGSAVKGSIALLQCLISFDFALGFSSVRAFLDELFANRMLLEEFFYGERLPRYHIILSLISMFSFFLISIYILFRAVFVWKNTFLDRDKLLPPSGFNAFILPSVFFISYAILLTFIEPGNPELWVMGLVPLALLICGAIFVPMTYDNKLWMPLLLIIIMIFHNGSAIKTLYDNDKNFNFEKGKMILSVSNKNDLVILASNPVFKRYFDYFSTSNILYLHDYSTSELMFNEMLKKTYSNIYILDDVFNQPKSLRVRFPDTTNEIDIFYEKLKENSKILPYNQKINSNVFKVYLNGDM